jgi:hypothetical protein
MASAHSLAPGGNVMECHSGRPDKPKVCVGFAVIVGPKSLGFRFAQALNLIDKFKPDPAPFHPSIDALLNFHPDCSTNNDEDTDNG